MNRKCKRTTFEIPVLCNTNVFNVIFDQFMFSSVHAEYKKYKKK